MDFWNSWELWEKLCFILAAGIVIVIILGCGKLIHNSWRLRKYAKIKADTMALKRELMHSRSVKRGRAKEVPFGIRALEKGVIIEGVWNSGANTPAPSSPGSPVLSVVKIAQKAYREPSASSTQTTTEIQKPSGQSKSPKFADASARGRKQYEPRRASGLRISNALSDIDRGEVLAELDAHEGGQSSSIKNPSPASSNSQQGSPTEDDHLHPTYCLPSSAASSYMSAESNPFLDPAAPRKSYDDSIALSHLNSLIPTDDPHQDDPAAYHAQLLEGAEITYGAGHAQPSASNTVPNDTLDGQQVQSYYPEDEGGQYSSATLQLEEDQSTSGLAQDRRSSHVVRKINSGFEILAPSTFGGGGGGDATQGPEQDRRASQVVRKINSGFEILAPGTFGTGSAPQNLKPGSDWRETWALGTAKEEQKKAGRKLQKKGKRESLVQRGG